MPLYMASVLCLHCLPMPRSGALDMNGLHVMHLSMMLHLIYAFRMESGVYDQCTLLLNC